MPPKYKQMCTISKQNSKTKTILFSKNKTVFQQLFSNIKISIILNSSLQFTIIIYG